MPANIITTIAGERSKVSVKARKQFLKKYKTTRVEALTCAFSTSA